MQKGSDLLVKALENEGVDRIFGVPGEENLDFLESLRNSTIELVLTRHEQAAAFMAATHGRLTGRPGVCLATLGPGALNFSTGAAYAYLGAWPMILITGQKAVQALGAESDIAADHARVVGGNEQGGRVAGRGEESVHGVVRLGTEAVRARCVINIVRTLRGPCAAYHQRWFLLPTGFPCAFCWSKTILTCPAPCSPGWNARAWSPTW